MNYQKRKDNKKLPGRQELSEILEKEIYFPFPQEKENIHYPEFNCFKDLLIFLNLATDLLDNDNLDIHKVVTEGEVLLNKIVKKISTTRKSEELRKLFDKMYDYLAEEDIPEKSDFIFVFGSKTPFRPEKAAELYKSGLSKNIIVSGGNPIYNQEKETSEAEDYKKILIDSGVPENKIIIEDQSITVPDNVRCTLKKLQDEELEVKSLILVNSPYSQRRGWTIFKKYLSDDVKLFRVNCKTGITKDNWFEKEENLRVVLNEFIKMRASVVYNTA